MIVKERDYRLQQVIEEGCIEPEAVWQFSLIAERRPSLLGRSPRRWDWRSPPMSTGKCRAAIGQDTGALVIWGWVTCDERQKEEGHKFWYNAYWKT
jgi:hypothetical protein